MAEPETEATDITLRAAEVAADVTETEQPQERRRLMTAFTRAATSGARAAGRGTRAAGRGTRAVRRGAGSGTDWLVSQVVAMAPRLRVRDRKALQAQFPGQSAEEIAEALIEGAAHAAGAAGGAAGMAAALPVLPAFPVEIAAETLVVVGIELKLVAELHEVYGTPAPGNFAERMNAYLAAWAHRRGVFMVEGGLIIAAGSPLARALRRRLTAKAGRSAVSLGPLLTGAAAAAWFNSRETRRLGRDIHRDLRRRAITSPRLQDTIGRGRARAGAAEGDFDRIRLGRLTGGPIPAPGRCCKIGTPPLWLAHANGQNHRLWQRPSPWRTTPGFAASLLSSRPGVISVPGTSPTARQRELGTRLRGLRNEHDMTVEDVADRLLCSATKISRLETGARRPSLRDVRDLCALYELDEETSAELMSLAREARKQGWWTEYDDLDLDLLIGLEQEAVAITCFSMSYIPGLLQTEDYARSIVQIVAPKMDPKVVNQRTEARLRRQHLLAKDNPPRYLVLLDEVVLRRRVGGAALMATQLDKVLDDIRNDKAVVQVIPFSAGAYAAVDGYFMLLEFGEDSDLWPVVFIEGLSDNQYLERRPDIARYRETIDYLRSRALDPGSSIKLISTIRAAYATP